MHSRLAANEDEMNGKEQTQDDGDNAKYLYPSRHSVAVTCRGVNHRCLHFRPDHAYQYIVSMSIQYVFIIDILAISAKLQ